MAKTNPNDGLDNLKRKLDKAIQDQNSNIFSRIGLKSPLREPTLAELVAEGDAIIEAEERTKRAATTILKQQEAMPKSAPKAETPKSNNPYVIARETILNKMDKFCRNEILEMERTGNKDNRIYNEFITEVRKEGDRLQQ